MLVAIQRPPGWMRVLPPLAPPVFSRIAATSNEGAACAKATVVAKTRASMVLMAQSLLLSNEPLRSAVPADLAVVRNRCESNLSTEHARGSLTRLLERRAKLLDGAHDTAEPGPV